MKPNTSFKQVALISSATTLSRRQLLLGGMAASTTAALLTAKPLALLSVAQSSATAFPTMGVFEALSIFLNASRIQR